MARARALACFAAMSARPEMMAANYEIGRPRHALASKKGHT